MPNLSTLVDLPHRNAAQTLLHARKTAPLRPPAPLLLRRFIRFIVGLRLPAGIHHRRDLNVIDEPAGISLQNPGGIVEAGQEPEFHPLPGKGA